MGDIKLDSIKSPKSRTYVNKKKLSEKLFFMVCKTWFLASIKNIEGLFRNCSHSLSFQLTVASNDYYYCYFYLILHCHHGLMMTTMPKDGIYLVPFGFVHGKPPCYQFIRSLLKQSGCHDNWLSSLWCDFVANSVQMPGLSLWLRYEEVTNETQKDANTHTHT